MSKQQLFRALIFAGLLAAGAAHAQTVPGQPPAGAIQIGQGVGALPSFIVPTGEVTITSGGVTSLSRSFSPVMTGNWTLAPASGDALTINPAAASYAKAFNITQSSAAASQAGPINFNLMSITYSGTATGSGNDSFGLALADVNGLRINFTNSSSNNTQNGVSAFSAAVRSTVGGPQVIGGNFSNYSNVTGMGPMFGGVSMVWLDTGGTGGIVIGHETDVQIGTGTGATYRIGYNAAAPLGAGTGATLDSAYTISATASGTPFTKGFTLTKNLYGTAPIATGGDWFFVDAAMAVANVFNAANLTVGTSIMVFKNFTVDNIGGIVSGSSAAATGVIQIQPSTNTTTGATGIDVRNAAQVASSTGTEISFEANEASRTTVRYGLTLGNWAEFTAFGGGSNGLVIGEFINAPIVFGTNNAEALRILGAGNVKFTNAANFAANNARTVTVGNVGPAAIGATIVKWLTFQDSGGTASYVPVWQ